MSTEIAIRNRSQLPGVIRLSLLIISKSVVYEKGVSSRISVTVSSSDRSKSATAECEMPNPMDALNKAFPEALMQFVTNGGFENGSEE